MLACVDAGDDGVDDACGAVDDVEGRVEAVVGLFAGSDLDGVFVCDPAGPVSTLFRSSKLAH